MRFSQYQEDIFAAIEDIDASIFVEALAGSGKTTTIVEAANRVPPTVRTTFVAFNKSIADELRSRVPSNVKASTLHSMGLSNIRYRHPSVQVDDQKMRKLAASMGILGQSDDSVILRLASLGKTTDSIPDCIDFKYLVDRFEIMAENDIDMCIVQAKRLLQQSLAMKDSVDFDDMIWLPAIGEVQMYQSDVMFVDESQDLNPAQIAMVRHALRPMGRVIAVGDRHQSIYGFRGADLHAVDRLVEEFDAMTLPLNVCYRCAKNIIDMAKLIVPQIESAPNAIDGEVTNIAYERMLTVVKSSDMILCRVNAPLVKTALHLIAMGVKAQIRGRDIGKSLIALVNKIRRRALITQISAFAQHLTMYADSEMSKLLAADKISQAMALQDQVDTLLAIADGVKTVDEMVQRIEFIFTDAVEGVTLSSIHRAKGTEADTVYLLRADLLPHPMAKQPWQKEQEMNLKYVAITRVRRQLVMVQGG